MATLGQVKATNTPAGPVKEVRWGDTQLGRQLKLKAARKEYARRQSAKYRQENLDERRRREREWHRLHKRAKPPGPTVS